MSDPTSPQPFPPEPGAQTPATTPPEPTPPAPPPAHADLVEKPACFYLGREYDLRTKTVLRDLVEYDARDLTTHGVVVGMTGSGKTGLCVSLLEEAAIDGIPCIIIDPKGDLANMLLQFPDLDPKDFERWLNPEDARIKGLTLEEHAAQLADRWRKGLEESKQPTARIRMLRESAEWRVYTPGSEAGLPLSILKTFAAPKEKVTREALNQKIDATATALLGLTGTAADPVQSREHILIAQLLLNAWGKGQDIDLHTLIAQIQEPPLSRVGALDLETFYPEKDRLKLAVALNNILAAPSFSTWINGEPLDIGAMLGGGRKPRHLIFYVAHLEESQRVFFISLLLEAVLSWTRKQPGTSSLRAILYFDEVFGYLPPHPANPPTKLPLMTMLKQARAFGVGVLLATQNPVDLDYKALSNAGTWFVGKLQTERDKARLIEGLEGVAAAQGTLSNRSYLETVISALGNRVFLLHDVHRPRPLLFQTRHALSFLRGPMTRDQIAELMKGVKESVEAEAPAVAAVPAEPVAAVPAVPARQEDAAFREALRREAAQTAAVPAGTQRPPRPEGVEEVFLLRANPIHPTGAKLIYQPRLYGVAEIAFLHRKLEAPHRQTHKLLAQPPDATTASVWQTAERFELSLIPGPEGDALWGELPDAINTGRKLKALEKSLSDFLYNDARLRVPENTRLGLVAVPGEDAVTFRERCRAAARKQADAAVAEERAKYQPKFAALGVPMPEGPPQEEGGGLLDVVNPLWWFGWTGKKRPAGRGGDRAARLEAEWHAKQGAIYGRWERLADEVADLLLKPRREDVQVRLSLAWAPFWQVESAPGRAELFPAYR